MKKFPYRKFIEPNAYHQKIGINEEATAIVGISKVGGTRSQPTLDCYIDILIPQTDVLCWRFGVNVAFESQDLSQDIIENTNLNQILDFLVFSGHMQDTEYARKIISSHFRDTLVQALGCVWEKRT